MAMNNPNQANWSDMIKNWWNGTPFLNKAIITCVCALYLLNLLTDDALVDLLADIPSETLKYFQIWRIFTAFIIHFNLMQVIFCLLSFMSESCRLEKVLGTTAFLVDVIIKNIVIQVFYLFIIFILHFPFPELFSDRSCGLWDIVMVYITIRSASNPEQPTQFLCLPIIIKSKYYPIFIILLFSLLSGAPISLIASLIVGYLETYFFNGLMIRLSRSKAVWLENKLLGCFKTRPDFISAENLESPYFSSDNNRNSFANLGAPANNLNVAASNNNYMGNLNVAASNNNYMGGRGVAIGGASNNPVPPQRPPPQHPVRLMKNESQSTSTTATTTTKPFSGKGTLLGSGLSASDNDHREKEIENVIEDESLTELTSQGIVPQGKNAYVSLVNEKDDKKDKIDLI